MAQPSLLAQLLATDPRKLARLPDISVDAAMAELRRLREQIEAAPTASAGASSAPAEPAPAPAAVPAPAPSALPDGVSSSLSALATHVWRAKGKLVDEAGVPRDETRRAFRHIESAFEAFAQMGLTMNDWIGQPYDPGLPVKVLTFQPTPDVTRDTVVEAVRPTVIWRDQLLQLGEVIVGIPPDAENSPKTQ